MKRSLLTLAIVASLYGCGGGGGSSKDSTDNTGGGGDGGGSTVTQTGVFLDSPVAGIGYRTATKSGVTNAQGEYEYVEGEAVTFFVGDLALPPVTASGVVTPADIAAGNATAQTNMLQLLQSLDQDGDPSNGITIKPEAANAFQGVTLDITAETFDTEVGSVLTTIGSTLVSEENANKHFDVSLRAQILGSWLYSEGTNKRNILTFIDDSHYIIIHEHDDAPGEEGSQTAGSVEYGTYEWNVDSGAFTVELIGESDGWGGLYDEGSPNFKVTVKGSSLTLNVPEEGNVVFTRVTSPSNPLVGAWSLSEIEDNNLNILTFLSASEYVIAHTNNQESYDGNSQALSGEFGTYSLAADGRFRAVSASVDTDGDGGLFNATNTDDQANETMAIMPWGDLRFVEDDEGTFSFQRIGSFVATLQDFDASGKLGTIQAIRDPMGFDADDIADRTFQIDVDFADGTESTFALTFNNDYALDPETEAGTGTASVREVSEDVSFPAIWTINSTGAVEVLFRESEELRFKMTIAKLVGNSDTGPSKVLLSLRSTEGEDSLWESTLEPVSLIK